MSAPFRLEIREPGRVDVFLAAPTRAGRDVPWALVERLDRAGIRVVGDPLPRAPGRRAARPDPARLRGRRVRRAGGGGPGRRSLPATAARPRRGRRRRGGVLGPRSSRTPRACAPTPYSSAGSSAGLLPRARGHPRGRGDGGRPASRAYGPTTAATPATSSACASGTRLLIKHATFVIADLTLGIESPERENPSRAHEIGMAVAYERPLLLCSQEPRRYPYFSIGDMQMSFWLTEDELEAATRDWIALNRSRRWLTKCSTACVPASTVHRGASLRLRQPRRATSAPRRPRAGRAATTGRRRDERLVTCASCFENRVLRDEQILARAERMYLCAPRQPARRGLPGRRPLPLRRLPGAPAGRVLRRAGPAARRRPGLLRGRLPASRVPRSTSRGGRAAAPPPTRPALSAARSSLLFAPHHRPARCPGARLPAAAGGGPARAQGRRGGRAVLLCRGRRPAVRVRRPLRGRAPRAGAEAAQAHDRGARRVPRARVLA